MTQQPHILVCFLYLRFFCVVGNFNGFMDNVYFSINWAGPQDVLQPADSSTSNEDDFVVMTTNNNEKYRCILPNVIDTKHKDSEDTTPAFLELDLLKHLFDQTTCTYRLETYWTYELCHGRYIRQYHEEKEMGKTPKLQEYYLGRYKMETFWADYKKAKENRIESQEEMDPKIQKVQGIEIPFYEVVYTGGTICDLTGQPRKAFVHYVCQLDGRGEIYEIKEMSSCEYEVVILTSHLCSHPTYGPKKEPTNEINCHSVDASPKRPQNLQTFEIENTLEQFNSKEFWEDDSSLDEDDQQLNILWDLVGQIMKEHGIPDYQDPSSSAADAAGTNHRRPQQPLQDFPATVPSTDKQILKDFLDGTFCIEGGAGWWKHKFCYGKDVTQFHQDNLRRDVIVLGRWDEDVHLDWMKSNQRLHHHHLNDKKKAISHFYGDGDACDLNGKKRFVEVKLNCAGNPNHPNAVTIYLTEPNVCEYRLIVESPLFCDLIAQADENGLVANPKL